VARVRVTPENFELVEYDSGVIAGLTEELAARVGIPDDAPIEVEIDEELPLPLTGSTADVRDGKVVLWFSGADFEDPHNRAKFHEQLARSEIALALFRGADRLAPAFAGAPVDDDLDDAQRQIWESWGEGRVAGISEHTRRVRRQYMFRLYNGFTDLADSQFDRVWNAPSGAFTWADLEQIRAECAAVDPRPTPKKKAAIRKETLKAAGD
jgi:hypothetical protein